MPEERDEDLRRIAVAAWEYVLAWGRSPGTPPRYETESDEAVSAWSALLDALKAAPDLCNDTVIAAEIRHRRGTCEGDHLEPCRWCLRPQADH